MNDVRGSPERTRGTLRVYLGAAPGVGKTFAMLNEGRRRVERGADVVVGFVETHGRDHTAEQIGDLEVVPRRRFEHRGSDARPRWTSTPSCAAAPSWCSSTSWPTPTRPGSRHEKRWQDVDELLDAGIDVISTVNVQHLESLNDVVERITGIRQRETIPDHVVRAADQIELVDMAPEALRRRLAHGNVYGRRQDRRRARQLLPRRQPVGAARAGAAVGRRPRRRLAAGLPRAPRHHADRGRPASAVVVALAGAPDTDHLVRRAARIAPARQGRPDRRARRRRHRARRPARRAATSTRWPRSAGCSRSSAASTGGSPSNDVAAALVDLARSENATQIVLGASGRSRWHELVSGSVINRVVRLSGPIDVHVISRARRADDARRRRAAAAGREPVLTPLSPRRQLWGWALAARRAAADHACRSPTSATRSGCRACCCSTSCWRWSWPSSAACCRPSSPCSAGSCSPTGTSRRRSTA